MIDERHDRHPGADLLEDDLADDFLEDELDDGPISRRDAAILWLADRILEEGLRRADSEESEDLLWIVREGLSLLLVRGEPNPEPDEIREGEGKDLFERRVRELVGMVV